MSYVPGALVNLRLHKPLLSPTFKYNFVPRFRHKIDARTSILKAIIPEDITLGDEELFKLMYYDERYKMIGSDLLTLRIYHYLLQNNDIDCVNPHRLNTLKLRHDFINQFNHILDSKNRLAKYKFKNTLSSYKLEKRGRHKLLPSLIGLIHSHYGKQKTEKFIDEWVILGQWSKEGYTHKGLAELYTEKSLKLY